MKSFKLLGIQAARRALDAVRDDVEDGDAGNNPQS